MKPGLAELLNRYTRLPVQARASICSFVLLIMLSPAVFAAAPESDPAQGATLELGVAPFLPVRTFAKNYQPMREYLDLHLKQPVIFVTAPDYKIFHERSLRHEYPVIITVANAAYLAYTEAGYVPMLRPMVNTCPVIVVPVNSRLKQVQDLRGKTVALPEPLAMIAMQSAQLLLEFGLEPGKDVILKHLPNHSAAVNHVIAGEAAAAIVSDRALLQMPAATQAGVRTIYTWKKGAVPGVVYLASPVLQPKRIAQLTGMLLEFSRDTPEGRELMKKLGYEGLVPATGQDLEPLSTYGEMFRKAIIETSAKEKSE